MDIRNRAGGDGATPGWQWSAEASGEGVDGPPKDENWAATSGFDAGFRSRPSLHATVHDDDENASNSSGFSGFSDAPVASDASWVSDEDGARSPLEHNHFHYRRGHGDEHDDSHDFIFGPPPPRQPTAEEEAEARYRRRFKPRTCRICFETVLPTFEDRTGGMPAADFEHDIMGQEAQADEPVGLGAAVNAVGEATAGLRGRVAGAVTAAMPTFLRSSMPRVRYISESPEDGRLISPCHCKGSQKYVHEGCLQAWRIARPLAERNFWKCPTCGFEYRMQRLSWGRLISNKATRALLTLLVFILTLFVLGFIADPLMDLWVDPSGVIMDAFLDLGDFDADDDFLHQVHDVLHGGGGGIGDIVQPTGWWEHFIKGFFSLGIVGVIKTFLVVSPFTWFNLRGVGLGRGRRRAAGGRGRYDSFMEGY
ncbi:hypothetical protein SBRCBS47491_003168 [Sporothrix bragantina]|uniref:RING-CH-type domain-containing protein n=1 Tax=Sporothrix bragantina TaxID=671064 RepID=A0ABP0BD02_9PEZI